MADCKITVFIYFCCFNFINMDTLECLLTRRSIRKYLSDKPVPDSIIEILIEAGMYAPTARNLRGWHFVVINKPDLLSRLSEVHPYGKMLVHAALGILVCGDLTIEKEEAYNAINCAAATQNILLAAHALGLGAVWLGVYPRADRMAGIKAVLQLPDHVLPISLISIGYPDEHKDFPIRKEKEKIHFNGW
jgi:nitroreductase